MRIDNNFCYFLKYLCSPEKGCFSCVVLKRAVFCKRLLLLFDASDLCLEFWLLKLFCKVLERSVSGSFRENLFQFWLLIPGFVCFTDVDFFSVFCIIFVTLDSFLCQLVIHILLLLPLWQNLMTFRSMMVFLFYRCVICVKHLNLQLNRVFSFT